MWCESSCADNRAHPAQAELRENLRGDVRKGGGAAGRTSQPVRSHWCAARSEQDAVTAILFLYFRYEDKYLPVVLIFNFIQEL